MKHLHPITHQAPGKAAAVQDILCALATTLNAFLLFLGVDSAGGEGSPVLNFVEDKCAFPTPGDDTSTGG